MSTVRRAALRLRSLDAKDRDWLLRNLSDDERGRIEPLLEELGSMRVAEGPDWIEALGSQEEDEGTPTRGANAAGNGSADLRELSGEEDCGLALDGAHAGALASLLRTEPDCVVAALLACADWSWRKPFMRSLPRARRRELIARRREGPRDLTPAMRSALVEAATRRLRLGRASGRARTNGGVGFEAMLAKEEARARLPRWLRRRSPWVR